MGDFYQNGIITTLHNLCRRPVEELERELMEFRKERPMSLVLPSTTDILTYSRDLVARLIYPVANPGFNYMFCKGYYARVADGKMNGRVSRLLVTPLIRALKKVCGPSDFLDYLDSYRYPLAGEFSFRTDVINDLRIPSDWGLEVGVLSEMKRNYATNRLCQVDIADTYDHKHQELSPEDASRGLSVERGRHAFHPPATNPRTDQDSAPVNRAPHSQERGDY